MTERQRAFADALLTCGAVKFGAFRLKLHETHPDAPLSPIYVDLRVLRSFPDATDIAVEVLAEMIAADGIICDLFADIPQAATPLVAVLSHVTRVPMITPREVKTHGATGQINGAYHAGETVLVIDDVITDGESKVEALRVLESHGLRVRDVAVLVDREQGGVAQMRQAGYALHAAVTLTQLLEHWRATKALDLATYERVRAYRAGA
jgi:uridine monophosphate synthetase